MSLVSNFIGGISSANFGSTFGVSEAFDINDTTFSDILDKQLAVKSEDEKNGIEGLLGIPAGFQIDGIDYSEKVADQIEAVGEKISVEKDEFSSMMDANRDNDVTTSEVATFFTSLLENNLTGQQNSSQLFSFANKQAATMYSKFSRTMVTNLEEFVNDAHEILN